MLPFFVPIGRHFEFATIMCEDAHAWFLVLGSHMKVVANSRCEQHAIDVCCVLVVG